MSNLRKIIGHYGKDLAVVLIVALVAMASFQIGRLSMSGNSASPIWLLQANLLGATNKNANAVEQLPQVPKLKAGGEVVASKNGTRYYFPWCKAASRINDENKIYFASEEKAIEAGYTAAQNCAGL